MAIKKALGRLDIPGNLAEVLEKDHVEVLVLFERPGATVRIRDRMPIGTDPRMRRLFRP